MIFTASLAKYPLTTVTLLSWYFQMYKALSCLKTLGQTILSYKNFFPLIFIELVLPHHLSQPKYFFLTDAFPDHPT